MKFSLVFISFFNQQPTRIARNVISLQTGVKSQNIKSGKTLRGVHWSALEDVNTLPKIIFPEEIGTHV